MTPFQDKNISMITKQLHAAVVGFYEVGTLTDETFDSSCSFTECNNEYFKANFWYLLTLGKNDHLHLCFTIATPYYDSSSSEPTFANAKVIFQDTNNLYNFLTSNKWLVYHKCSSHFMFELWWRSWYQSLL